MVVDDRGKTPRYALRFRAYGERHYVALGSVADGWTQERAQTELANVLADVRRGLWRPADRNPALVPSQPADPTFHEFASGWYRDNEPSWRPNTRVDYQWQLSNHILPFFRDHRLSQITVAEIDRFRAAKVRDGQLSATSINKLISRLAQILETAVEYELIDRNPAKGKRRRVKASKPAPVWLDRPEHISALLSAAGQLDAQARRDRSHVRRRAIIATLLFSGLRLNELQQLRWRDVDLVAGRIRVRESKTDAGAGREIDLLPVLRAELARLPRRGPDDLVFPTSKGRATGQSNIRRRILAPAIALADERLVAAGDVPLPAGLSPHKLRHSYASLLVALGVDPSSVMSQLGHTDPAFTLRVYTHGLRRDPASKEALRQLVGGPDWAAMGSNVVSVAFPQAATSGKP